MSPKGVPLTTAQRLARAVSEQQFQADVVAYATLMRWKFIYHVPDSRRVTSAGFPDLVMVRNGRLLFLECKKVGGVLSPAQRAWLDALGTMPGVEAVVVTPEDWPAILSLLR